MVCGASSVYSCYLFLIYSASVAAAATAKLLQSCLTLCNPIEGSPPGSPVPGILQARTLEWVAISFSDAGKWKVKVKLLSHFRLLATPWTAAHQAPLSMGFSRQEYWSGVPLPSLMELPVTKDLDACLISLCIHKAYTYLLNWNVSESKQYVYFTFNAL